MNSLKITNQELVEILDILDGNNEVDNVVFIHKKQIAFTVYSMPINTIENLMKYCKGKNLGFEIYSSQVHLDELLVRIKNK